MSGGDDVREGNEGNEGNAGDGANDGPNARVPERLGAHVHEGATHFTAYATSTARCELRLFEGLSPRTLPMAPRGDGLFSCSVPGVGHGARYKFVLDGTEFPDPYARFLPDGVHGPAQVMESRYAFLHPRPDRPLSAQVLYELHVGTFTREGTYRAASTRLAELAALGVTTLELMPLSAFPGTRGWGYDGVAHYAPHAAYGTPDELRHFIDSAHGAGLQVVLDVVYNHFGPAGNYLGAYSPEYFTREIQTPWGEAPRVDAPPMRRYVLDNARYWLSEFRFDGLRLDATHTIVDSSETHVIRALAEASRSRAPHVFIMAEDERNDPSLVQDMGCDAIWADDFHHQVRVTLTGERDGYFADYTPGAAGIARCITRGWLFEGQVAPRTGKARGAPAGALGAERFVYCIQNHDQIGNRALGARLNHDVSVDAYCAATALLLFLPMTPLLFMGQEWAASTPFQFFTDHDAELGALVTEGRRREFAHFAAFADPAQRAAIPDPQSLETFERSKLRWDERSQAPHDDVLQLYRALLALRRNDHVLREPHDLAGLEAEAHGELLAVRRRTPDGSARRLLLVNFGQLPVDCAAARWYADGMPRLEGRRVDRRRRLDRFGFVIFAG